MYEQAAEEFGRIDVLFNNAGINPTDDASVLDTSVDAWQRVQDVNVKSIFLCCKHGIPHLLDNGGGSVINTASFVAVMGAAMSQISYTASKGAVLAMSREMGVEFGDRGVRVNALCPGPVNTPLLRELFAKDPDEGRPPPGPPAPRPLRRARGDRQGGAVPRQRRQLLHHRRPRSWSTAGSRAPTSRPSSRGLRPAQRRRRGTGRPSLGPSSFHAGDRPVGLRRAGARRRARFAPRPRRCASRRSSGRRRRCSPRRGTGCPRRVADPEGLSALLAAWPARRCPAEARRRSCATRRP